MRCITNKLSMTCVLLTRINIVYLSFMQGFDAGSLVTSRNAGSLNFSSVSVWSKYTFPNWC